MISLFTLACHVKLINQQATKKYKHKAVQYFIITLCIFVTFQCFCLITVASSTFH